MAKKEEFMETENSAVIHVDNEPYELLLTMRATREIAKRYGGLEPLADKLLSADKFEDAIGEVSWLITLLANQSVMINNLRNPGSQRPLLTEEKLELLTTPYEIAGFKDAIMESLAKGAKRTIENEPEPKNPEAG